MLLACTLFSELVAILSKSLQYTAVNIVKTVEGVLKTKKSIEQLKATAFDDLPPTVKKVISRLQYSADKQNQLLKPPTYQGITYYKTSVAYLSKYMNKYMGLS